MKLLTLKLIVAAGLILPAVPAMAMDHMMHKMSAGDMKKLKACKAMDHEMAMKNKRCVKLMKAEEMSMHHDDMGKDAMPEHKM
jgi:hypothetical protein